ncbi:MAG: ABC transporter ATP-binding protein [Solobacterium sp.]|jgi:simple sugar transport system ATP-binding protein|nr:ABC transporter ATP-binding protein [Solobacterium sp.]MCH4223164.1 ABC transporter ATP-binding protein [Solobacterium sp.]MCH4266692.1 ABC transporter ATP-binding protein [Solobacterium sp.]
MENEFAVRMVNVTKTFGSVVANDSVSLDIRFGEILSLLGENGSGKTTLMNMLAGLYYPDFGEIFINGKQVSIESPHDAYALGIGMVHQHFKLIDVFNAVENIVLGETRANGKYDLKAASKRIHEITDRYGFELDEKKKVYEMSVAEKQTLEIIKVLYRGANILILDEPTAVLTPQETEKLFNVLREMRKDGKAVVLITHKLNEVLELSDRVTVLRHGQYISTVDTSKATELSLTEEMVGEKVTLDIERPTPDHPQKRLDISHLTVYSEEKLKTLDDVSFTVYGGEILGIAGISGCGQKELLEAIAGLQIVEPGSKIEFDAPDGSVKDLVGRSPREIASYGVNLSFVPEDRLGMGLVASMGMSANMMLKDYEKGKSPFLNRKDPQELASRIREELDVSTPSLDTPVRKLSGGNVQKVLVGREIASSPTVLLTAYAVRGLDITKSYTIYGLLNEQKKKGVAVVYVGEDLDVLMALSDRILVLCGGKANGMLDARTATKEEIGRRMTELQGVQA